MREDRAGLSTSRGLLWFVRTRSFALPAIALAALLLVACGGEQAEEAAVVEEMEPAGTQEETGSREAPDPTESQKEVEPIGVPEEKVVPEPETAFTQETAKAAQTVPPAPPPQPEPSVAGISVTQTVVPPLVTVGQQVTFTATVKNNSTTQRAALKDFLPPGMSLVSATPSQGSCGASHHGGNIAECSLGAIPSEGSATVGIVATPTVAGTMTNTVVTLAEFTPATPASTASATVTVSPAASGANAGTAAHKAH